MVNCLNCGFNLEPSNTSCPSCGGKQAELAASRVTQLKADAKKRRKSRASILAAIAVTIAAVVGYFGYSEYKIVTNANAVRAELKQVEDDQAALIDKYHDLRNEYESAVDAFNSEMPFDYKESEANICSWIPTKNFLRCDELRKEASSIYLEREVVGDKMTETAIRIATLRKAVKALPDSSGLWAIWF
jgi:uncharacterized membrane protein YvbJ